MPKHDSQDNSSLRSVIFDMDGVLIDSNPIHVEKWAEFLTERGVDFKSEDLPRQILGHGNFDCFRAFFGSSLSREEMRELENMLESRFRETFARRAAPLPGLVPLLEAIRDEGIPLAVASSAVRDNVEFVLETLRLKSFFPVVVTGDDFPHAKPHPGIYLLAAEKLATPPADCVAFEDSFVGIEAAKRAGMKCIAVASSFPEEDLRTQTEADGVIGGFEKYDVKQIRSVFPLKGS